MRSLAVFAVALAFAPAAAAALPSPCTLLTESAVAKLLGSKIESRAPSGNGRDRSCTWTGVNMSGPGFYAVHRTLMVQLAHATKAQFERGANDTNGAVRVSGVGKVAYATTGPLKELNAWQSGYTLSFIATFAADPLSTEKAAAKLLVKNV